MTPTPTTTILSRLLVPLFGFVVWALFYLDARLAYRMPRGMKKLGYQLATVLGAVGVFFLQVNFMERLTSGDGYGNYFFYFVMIESGGAMMVLFFTLFREKARSKKIAPTLPR